MIIKASSKTYQLTIEPNWDFFASLTADVHAFFVIDEMLYGLYAQKLLEHIPQDRLFLLTAVEENKTIETALRICELLTSRPEKRNLHLVSIGGGITQDVTGFVANVLYRGIKWTFLPTTLLAACDSCIGGKTSLNYKNFKNLLGTFYPPDDIHIYPPFFETLCERDFQSGLGEVIKFNIMAGSEGLTNIENNIDSLLNRDEASIVRFVTSSLAFKKPFIEADEFDCGVRVKLNFAHTFGHAIETVTHYQIPHGTAVAIGMIMANDVSLRRGLLDEDTARRSERVLLKVINVPCHFGGEQLQSFVQAIHKDKKQIGQALTAVLLTDAEERLKIVHDIQVSEIVHAVNHFQRQYDEAKRLLEA